MQDNRTGLMVPIDNVFGLEEELSGLMSKKDEVKKAGEKAGIPFEHQGLVLTIGQEVIVREHNFHRSRKFIVQGFEGGLLHLRGATREDEGTTNR